MKSQHGSLIVKVSASRICGDVLGSCVLKWIRRKELGFETQRKLGKILCPGCPCEFETTSSSSGARVS